MERMNPADFHRVGLLRPAAIVASPDDRADAVEQPRLLGVGGKASRTSTLPGGVAE